VILLIVGGTHHGSRVLKTIGWVIIALVVLRLLPVVVGLFTTNTCGT
jgi:cytochrome b